MSTVGTDKPVRVAQIGCGFYGQNHLHAWRDLAADGADPDRCVRPGRREGTKPLAKHLVFRGTRMPRRCWLSSSIDLVDITTRMDTHRMLAALAADRGVAAIVQKPFAPTWEDCLAIVAKAEAEGTWLAVHENFRFATAMSRVRQLLASDTIGTPTWARISFRTGFDVYRGQPYFYDEERLAILDTGVHVLDLARVFLGDVERVYCEIQRRNSKVRAEDTATMMLRRVSGAVSIVECTYEMRRVPDPFPETLLEIEGPKGSIVVTRGERLSVTTDGLLFEEHAAAPLLPWTTRPWHVSQEAVRHANANMLAALRSGRPAETSGEDNLKTYALAEAAYQSAASHAAVRPKA